MSGWRTIVITERCKLDLRYGNMNIRKNSDIKKVFIKEIGVLIIESTSVSLTSALLSELIKNKVKVIFCDEKHNPESELVSYYGSYDTSERIKHQINWSTNIKEKIWTLIIYNKIFNQLKTLKYYDCEEYKLLLEYIEQIEPFDRTNREGHSAKVYFNALFGKEFTRDNKENIINMALNYGYSIILSLFNREIVSNGYLTSLGIFHSNKFNQFNLSSDLMEPFRPIIDSLIISMNINDFGKEEKRMIQSVFKSKFKIKNKFYYLPDVISIYVKSILDSLDKEDTSNIWFYEYEL